MQHQQNKYYCSSVFFLLVGSHSGVNIAETFNRIISEFRITNYITYVITDNASNMKKAFSIPLIEQEEDRSRLDDNTVNNIVGRPSCDVDLPELWDTDTNVLIDMEVDEIIKDRQRLSCFAHSLQLAVGDGLKHTKSINLVLGKICKISALLHTSASFKEKFEDRFGSTKGIPQVNSTRWNSMLRQVQAVLKLSHTTLNELVEPNRSNLSITLTQHQQLSELNAILEPFADATNDTQGDTFVTVSRVAPLILYLNHFLQDLSVVHLKPMVAALRTSLRIRFRGIFASVNMTELDEEELRDKDKVPFSNDIYVVAAFLDPGFKLYWVEEDALLDQATKDVVTTNIIG